MQTVTGVRSIERRTASDAKAEQVEDAIERDSTTGLLSSISDTMVTTIVTRVKAYAGCFGSRTPTPHNKLPNA